MTGRAVGQLGAATCLGSVTGVRSPAGQVALVDLVDVVVGLVLATSICSSSRPKRNDRSDDDVTTSVVMIPATSSSSMPTTSRRLSDIGLARHAPVRLAVAGEAQAVAHARGWCGSAVGRQQSIFLRR